jgi:hypothetical protein
MVSLDDEEERQRKLMKTNKDVARVERAIATILDETGDLEKARVYYRHSQKVRMFTCHGQVYSMFMIELSNLL